MSARPAKPWERSGGSGVSSASPLGPSTASNGQPKPWEQPQGAAGTTATAPAAGALARPATARSWERQGVTNNGIGSTSGAYGSSYGTGLSTGVGSYGSGGYGATSMYGSPGYGSTSMYGRPAAGAYGSSYGAGYGGNSMYGSTSMYGGSGYGMNSGYGLGYGGSSLYGGSGFGGMGGGHGSSYGSPYGQRMGYGGGGYGTSPYGGQMGALGPPGPYDPHNPDAPPPQPPSAWQHLLHGIGGVMHFFGRLSFLVDENAHAVHFFISALLQLLDRAGSLYGELARFVLRLLGYKPKEKAAAQHLVPGIEGQPRPGPGGANLPGLPGTAPQPPARGGSNWDNVWGR